MVSDLAYGLYSVSDKSVSKNGMVSDLARGSYSVSVEYVSINGMVLELAILAADGCVP